MEPNRIVTVSPVALVLVVPRYRTAPPAEPGTQHNPRGEVAATHALDPDQLHHPRRRHRDPEEPPDRADPHQVRARSARGSDVPKCLARERLPLMTVKTPAAAATSATIAPIPAAS